MSPIDPLSQLGSAEERENIHFFRHFSSDELSGFSDSAFWQRQILQAVHMYPAIRHAVAGIGALHRKFVEGQEPAVPDDPSDKQLRFALKQSNKAIREILVSSSTRSLEDKLTMMAACILFDCLSCLQGHQTVSLEHIRNGLRLLAEVEQEVAENADANGHHPVPLNSIRAMFISRNLQARSIMSNEALRHWEPHPKGGFPLDSTPFQSFTHARTYFESLLNNLLAMIQGMDMNPPADKSHLPAVMEGYEEMIAQFNTGTRLLDEFLEQQAANGVDREDRAVLSLQLSQIHARFFLNSFKYWDGTKEFDWDVDETYFMKMVELAGRILKDEINRTRLTPLDYQSATSSLPARPVFTPGTEVCGALWTVACRSRSHHLRRQAIHLLRTFPRREGVWDSTVAATIAETALGMEEAAALAELGSVEQIPRELRVRSCALTYLSLRSAKVEIRNFRQHMTGQRGIVRYLKW